MAEDPGNDEPIRFADILTTASAIANYLGEADVRAGHLVEAIAILRGEHTLDDLGRPTSPLVPRPRSRQSGADDAVKELVQRWFRELGGDANAPLTRDQLARFLTEVHTTDP